MLKVVDHSEKDSELKRLSFSFVASSSTGSAFGPEMPALVIRRSMCFSFLEISVTRFSRSSLEVTSQGPALEMPQLKSHIEKEAWRGTVLCFLLELGSGFLRRSRELPYDVL